MKRLNLFIQFGHCRLMFFLLVVSGSLQFPVNIYAQSAVRATDPCDHLVIGITGISEDNGKRFLTYGPLVSYTHPLNGRLGLTGNAGLNFGMQNSVKYTKIQLLGGVSLLPPLRAPGKISFTPHLLAGITHVTSKYGGSANYSSGSTALSLAAGTDLFIPAGKRTKVALIADYNPALSTGGVKNNFRIGAGISINFCNPAHTTDTHQDTYNTQEKTGCTASKDTKELKISLSIIEETAKSIENIMNTIPRVEAKLAVKPVVNVKQGEECCAKDKPPATYTELKGGVEGSCEVNINLWGLPDINYSLKLWPVLMIAEFKCKLFAGPTGKVNLEGVGKFYGDLGRNPRPDCKACFYLIYKLEAFLRIGVKAGGSISLYHWSPFGEGKAGFDVTKPPDEKIEASAEASVSIGSTAAGTYGISEECKKPPPGLHGEVKLGKAKANLKFNVKLGPISFDPSFEVNLFDGFEFKY